MVSKHIWKNNCLARPGWCGESHIDWVLLSFHIKTKALKFIPFQGCCSNGQESCRQLCASSLSLSLCWQHVVTSQCRQETSEHTVFVAKCSFDAKKRRQKTHLQRNWKLITEILQPMGQDRSRSHCVTVPVARTPIHLACFRKTCNVLCVQRILQEEKANKIFFSWRQTKGIFSTPDETWSFFPETQPAWLQGC